MWKKVKGWATVELAALIGWAAVAILGLYAAYVMLTTVGADAPTGKEACYGVYGQSGQFYPSVQPPMEQDGLWYVITHETWDAVGSFEAAHTDRECLRRRYPGEDKMVPPVEGVDD